MLAEVSDLYRQSRKPHDIFWNTYVSRPAAAVVVHFLRGSSITPNQVTFVSLAVFAVSAAAFIAWPSWAGLVGAGLVLQVSYVLDCADGQLARVKNRATPVGAHLDFLMDELKAFALIAASSLRLFRTQGNERFLILGLAGLCIVASAISLTTFMRRPEYAPPPPPTGFVPPPPLPKSPIGLALHGVERLFKFIAHYPSYMLFITLANRLDLFLYAYVAVHALYVARSLWQIMLKLGRPGGGTT